MNQDAANFVKENLHHLVEKLRQERDEINLQIHLAKAETRDEWEHLERKWVNVQNKASSVGDVAGDASKDVIAATEMLGTELKKAYQRIKNTIASER